MSIIPFVLLHILILYESIYYLMDSNNFTTEDITKNRYKFFDIVGMLRRPDRNPCYIYTHINKNKFEYIDHPEIYESKLGFYIIIFSPYIGRIEYENEYDKIINDGWMECSKMYNEEAKTFFKIISKRSKKKNDVLLQKASDVYKNAQIENIKTMLVI